MTFTQLETFIALAESASFSRAAMRMGTSQSAVSHCIKALEQQLKARLVDRQLGLELTQAGQRLLLRAREMTALAAISQQEVHDAGDLKAGTVRIASFGPTSSMQLLPAWMALFKARYPNAQVRVEEESDERVDAWLLQRRSELGFVVLPDLRFETKLVLRDELVAIVPASDPLAKARRLVLGKLSGREFVMTQAGGGAVIEPMLQRLNVRPKILHHLTQMSSIVEFARQGLAISIAARAALPQAPKGVVYLPLTPAQPRQVGLACLSADKLSPLARAFWDMVPDQAVTIR